MFSLQAYVAVVSLSCPTNAEPVQREADRWEKRASIGYTHRAVVPGDGYGTNGNLVTSQHSSVFVVSLESRFLIWEQI